MKNIRFLCKNVLFINNDGVWDNWEMEFFIEFWKLYVFILK